MINEAIAREHLQARSDAVRDLLGGAGALLVAKLLLAELDGLVEGVLLASAGVLLGCGHGDKYVCAWVLRRLEKNVMGGGEGEGH